MLTSPLISLGACDGVGSCQQEQAMGWEDISHLMVGVSFQNLLFTARLDFIFGNKYCQLLPLRDRLLSSACYKPSDTGE